VRGMSVEQMDDGSHRIVRFGYRSQEVDEDRPLGFILETLFLLETQVRIFVGLLTAMPEITHPILIGQRLPMLGRKVTELWSLLDQRFPQDVDRWTGRERLRRTRRIELENAGRSRKFIRTMVPTRS
jgi:hypothetical protein